jgi:hypothetical protein
LKIGTSETDDRSSLSAKLRGAWRHLTDRRSIRWSRVLPRKWVSGGHGKIETGPAFRVKEGEARLTISVAYFMETTIGSSTS